MQLRAFILVVATVSAVVACQPNRQGAPVPSAVPSGIGGGSQPAIPPNSVTPAHDQGGISGGGGYLANAAKPVTERVKRELAQELRVASPRVFSKLPSGWDGNRIAMMVERVIESPLKKKDRDGSPLLLDHSPPGHGQPAIEMLEPFFALAVALQISAKDGALTRGVRSLKVLLLHEIAHYWVGSSREADPKAKQVAASLMDALQANRLFCMESDPAPLRRAFDSLGTVAPVVIQRVTGLIEQQSFFFQNERQRMSGRDSTIETFMTWIEERRQTFHRRTLTELDEDTFADEPNPLKERRWKRYRVDASQFASARRLVYSCEDVVPAQERDSCRRYELTLNASAPASLRIFRDDGKTAPETGASQVPQRELECEEIAEPVSLD